MRHENLSVPGTILITEDTYKLIAPMIEMEALVPVQVKERSSQSLPIGFW